MKNEKNIHRNKRISNFFWLKIYNFNISSKYFIIEERQDKIKKSYNDDNLRVGKTFIVISSKVVS